VRLVRIIRKKYFLLFPTFSNCFEFALQDAESELVVQEALDNIVQQKKITTIIIAHRLSTIRSADVINVLVSGEIVESGTHGELMEKQGYYRMLVEKQDHTGEKSGNESARSSRNNSEVDLTKLDSTNDAGEYQVRDTNMLIPHFAFRTVNFSYPTRPKKLVFDEFNLEIKQGETIALCGPRYVDFVYFIIFPF
jgi:ABC-type multidrug transport system fused ATPase/permease subunit